MDELKIDCHVHVLDPVRFPYADDAWYLPVPAETGTPEQLGHVLDAHGVRHAWASDWPFLRAPSRVDYAPLMRLFEQQLTDAAARRAVLWDTPKRLFGFGDGDTP